MRHGSFAARLPEYERLGAFGDDLSSLEEPLRTSSSSVSFLDVRADTTVRGLGCSDWTARFGLACLDRRLRSSVTHWFGLNCYFPKSVLGVERELAVLLRRHYRFDPAHRPTSGVPFSLADGSTFSRWIHGRAFCSNVECEVADSARTLRSACVERGRE